MSSARDVYALLKSCRKQFLVRTKPGALHAVGVPGEGDIAVVRDRDHPAIAAKPGDVFDEAGCRLVQIGALIAHPARDILSAAGEDEIFAKPGAGRGDMFVGPTPRTDQRRTRPSSLPKTPPVEVAAASPPWSSRATAPTVPWPSSACVISSGKTPTGTT